MAEDVAGAVLEAECSMKIDNTNAVEGNRLAIKIHNVLTGHDIEEIVIVLTCALIFCVNDLQEDTKQQSRLKKQIEKLREDILR